MTIVFVQNLRVPWGPLLVSRVACLFICPFFSNTLVLGAGAFSSNVIGELMVVSVRSLVTPPISVFPSSNVCVSLSLGLLGRLCFGCTVVSLGLFLSAPSSLPPSITFVGCTAVFVALSRFCLSVRVLLLFAPLSRLYSLYCGFLVSELVLLECACLPSPCFPRSPLLVALLFFEKRLE